MKKKIFFTSDTHFNHKNIIKYCQRPFKTVEEMNETLINNWNSVVQPDDTVYHIGDFGWGDISHFRGRLMGNIILIRGNHDPKDVGCFGIFDEVHEMLEIKSQHHKITLCHYAMRVWNKSHHNAWMLYGHSHGKLQGVGKTYDVGVDNNDFTPVSYEKLVKIMKEKPDNFNFKRMEQ